ncbi:MAG: hypothetical protein AAF560_31490, partial [Acidobacteriota bacterium]
RQVTRLGVQEYLDIQRLVLSRESWPLDELRQALCATLATRQEDLAQIESLFQTYLAAESSPEDADRLAGSASDADRSDRSRASQQTTVRVAPPRSGARQSLNDRLHFAFSRLSRRGAMAVAVLPVLCLLAGVHLLGRSVPVTSEPRIEQTAAPAPTLVANEWMLREIVPRTSVTIERAVYVTFEPELRHLLAFVPTLLMMTLGLRWFMLPGATRRLRQAQAAASSERGLELRRQLATEAAEHGQVRTLTYRVPTYLPLSITALDDAASSLGRVYRQERSLELDIPATVAATVATGGRVRTRFAAGRAIRELRVLIDTERGDQPWLSGFLRSLDHLERLGIRLTRYTFQHVPAFVTPVDGGPPMAFETLTRRFGSDPLLVFSRNLSPHSRTGRADWIRELNAWPLRAWIDPDPRPLTSRGRVTDQAIFQHLGLERFAWTDAGFLELARYLASNGEDRTQRSRPDLAPPLSSALRAWATCAALVPDATWDQLEAVRRHPDFPEVSTSVRFPWQLQHLLDWVEAETGADPVSGDGRNLELPAELVDRLIRDQRRAEARMGARSSLEERARRYLLEQLAAEHPPEEQQLSRLWWELKRASHRLVLEPEQAAELLERFRGSAVEHEAREMLTTELARQRDGLALADRLPPWAVAEKLRALNGEAHGAPLGSLIFGQPWLWLRALALATVLSTALVGMTRFIFSDDELLKGLFGGAAQTLRYDLAAEREVISSTAADEASPQP